MPHALPLPTAASYILGIFNLKEKFQLPCCPVASMNGGSFSSSGMSQQKEAFLILGAGEEAEEGQFTEYPQLTVTQSWGTSSQFWFKMLISNSKSLPFFKEDNLWE